MHETIATQTLKTGESMQIERVLAPDAERAARILPFLGHKPGEYRAHLEAAFADACDELETRFYVGLLDGQIVGNIMTVEAGGVGILGHVHTREDHRRKGVCRAIMGRQMEDFRDRGGHALLLGTGFQSPAYWIYHSFGFRDLPGARPGVMRFLRENEPEFLERFFASGPCRVAPAGWKHWPLAALLAALPDLPCLRSLTLGAWGVALLEGPYCSFFHRWGADPRAGAAVLESQTGAVVGVATLVPEGRWPDALLLDVFFHPQVDPGDVAGLIGALPPLPGKVQCFAGPQDARKIMALEQAGFRREAILPEQFRQGDIWWDALLYSRREDGGVAGAARHGR